MRKSGWLQYRKQELPPEDFSIPLNIKKIAWLRIKAGQQLPMGTVITNYIIQE
jgi:hypothetical protein